MNITTIKQKSQVLLMAVGILVAGAQWTQSASAQTRKNVFQAGESLTYDVKFGFIKLGTVVIQTANVGGGQASARMQFWTADVPFLNTKTTVTDIINTSDNTLERFQEHTQNGDRIINKTITYDRAAKTVTYKDDKIAGETSSNIPPFNDALSLVFQMRSWSGAVGHKYSFGMRAHDGVRPVTVNFTNKIEKQEVPALDDKEIDTRVLEGQADMGSSSPLGANGAFTAYISNDAAAVPVRIDMSIAVGSISLVLQKVKRSDWAAAK